MTVPAIPCAETLCVGLFPDTPVATPEGWRPASSLGPGQQVLTLGAGALSLAAIATQPPPLWVQVLPQGACGNRLALALPPGQPVLVEADAALPLTGDALALLPVQALEGWRGIAPAPNRVPPLVLQLDQPDLIYAGPGLILGLPGRRPGQRRPGNVRILSLAEARALVARLVAEDLAAALSQAALPGLGWG